MSKTKRRMKFTGAAVAFCIVSLAVFGVIGQKPVRGKIMYAPWIHGKVQPRVVYADLRTFVGSPASACPFVDGGKAPYAPRDVLIA